MSLTQFFKDEHGFCSRTALPEKRTAEKMHFSLTISQTSKPQPPCPGSAGGGARRLFLGHVGRVHKIYPHLGPYKLLLSRNIMGIASRQNVTREETALGEIFFLN